MTIRELLDRTGWKNDNPDLDLSLNITGGYAGDLLSWVMGRGQPGQAWITVQVHRNIIAVAALREFSCIIIADGASVPEDLIAKAEEENILILESGIPVYETAVTLSKLL
ncbi:MAG: hypothetical protein ACI4WR_10350 [Bulleidia sp.]